VAQLEQERFALVLLADARGADPQRQAALTAKVAASTARAEPGEPTASSTPARAGPATLPAQREKFSRAFASCSRAPGTICGTIAFEAGLKKAVAAPSIP
jgi:hypothetical protein